MRVVSDFTLRPALAHGTVVVGVFALLSALAFVLVASRCIHHLFLRREEGAHTAPENLLFCTHIGHYIGNLFLANVFLIVAGLIHFHWGTQSGISRGSLCSSQAIVLQIGLWSTGYFTVATGAHTCISLVFRARQVPWINLVCIAVGWSIALVVALVPHVNDNMYGPDGISCGVARQYRAEYFVLHSLPIFLCIMSSAAIYSLIFFVFYGKLGHKSDLEVNSGSLHSWSLMYDSSEYIRFIAVLAQTMFWYPFAFTVLLLPFCVVHLLIYSGYSVPGAGHVFANICYSMLGLVNVALLYNTFRVINPLFRAPVKVMEETEKSFGNNASQESLVLPRTTYMANVPDLALGQDNPKPPFHPTHGRSESESSTDSTTQLLGVKRKSSKYNRMRVRQTGQHLAPVPFVSNNKPGLTITIPEPPLTQAPSPPLVTVRLSANPCLLTPSSVESGSKHTHSPLNLGEHLAQFPPVPLTLSAGLVSNKSATLASKLGLPSVMQSSAPRFVVPWSTPSQHSPTRPDKGKGKAPAPPETPVPRIDITAPDSGSPRNSLSIRPLPRVPEIPDSDGSIYSMSSYTSSHSSSSNAKRKRKYLLGAPSRPCSSLRPLPTLPTSAVCEEEDITDGKLPVTPVSRSTTPASSKGRRSPSHRTTMTSVWSQESAWSRSQPPDEEATLAYERLLPSALTRGTIQGDQASVGAVPFTERRSRSPAGARPVRPLRPVKIASRLTVRFAQAIKGPITPKGFTMVNGPNDSAVGER